MSGFGPLPRTIRWLSLGGAVGLVGFHADLLRQRLADASIGEPGVALRWLATVGVLAGFGVLARRGVPLLRDRRSLILWLVVLLLHFGASPPVAFSPEWLALPAAAAIGFAGAELWALTRITPTGLRLALVLVRGRRERRPAARTRPFATIPTYLPRPPPTRG